MGVSRWPIPARRRSGLQLSLRGVGGVQGLWLAATLFALYALTVPSVLAVPRRRAGSAVLSRAGDETYRLPGEAQPLHYDITLTPHLEPAFSFDGTVDIAIQAVKDSDTLTLHADGLSISSCALDGTVLGAATLDAERQFMKLDLAAKGVRLRAGEQHGLTCSFSGTIRDDDKGFYRSSYYDEQEDKIKWLGVTQFEMTFARRAFPCFDEPGLRATFSLTLQHDKDVSVQSNTRPSTISRGENNLVKTKFETTPAMPVYTLAWLVSQMPYLTGGEDVDFRTFAQPDNLKKTALSLSVGPLVLKGMAEYTGIPYALDKMDQVALPDHNFGAMENWGLVTYREVLLLADGRSRSASTLSVATTIAHELAHQWFGNLVTPSWWSHVWLSEAFAELFCFLMVDQVRPEWRVMDKMAQMEMQDAFIEDSLPSSAPMNNEVFTPEEILNNFGSITYAKGASVLRMLRNTISPATFQKGLQYYLRAMKASGVVRPDDLWAQLAKAVQEDGPLSVGVDFTAMAKSWTDQAGYPVVSVDRKGGVADLVQARFFSAGPSASDATLWHIPLTWRAEGDGTVMADNEFTGASRQIADVPASAKWILVNVDQLGYFRVNYDSANWQALADALRADVGALSVAERAMLVDDGLALARAGLAAYDDVLGLAEFLAGETASAPWAAFQNSIDFVAAQCRAAGDEDARDFDAWVQRLVRGPLASLGFSSSDSDSFDDQLTRSVVAQLALEAGDARARDEALLAYEMWLAGSGMDPDTLRLSLCANLRDTSSTSRQADFVDLLAKLVASEDEAERADFAYALGCAPEDDQVQLKTQLLLALLEAEGLRARDVKALWKSLVASQAGLRVVLDYATKNAADIVAKYGADKLTAMLVALAPRIGTQGDLDELESFLNGDATVPADLTKTLLDAARQNLDWSAKNRAAVMEYIRASMTTTPEPTDSTATTPSGGSTEPTNTPTALTDIPTAPTDIPTAPTDTPMEPTDTPTEPTDAPQPTPTPPASPRLPSTISPQLYVLIVSLLPDGYSFQGSVAINILPLDEDIDTIVLNAADLSFGVGDVKVSGAYDESTTVDVTGVTFWPDIEQVTISLGGILQPGFEYSLTIEYRGTVRSDLTGLYRTQIGSGQLVATQMWPAYARRVLPCFDEPSYRATMQLSVAHDAALTAIAGTALIDSSPIDPDLGFGDNATLEVFESTGKIPASQLSFVLFDGKLVRSRTSDKGFTTIFGRQELVDKAATTLSNAETLLGWFRITLGADTGLDQLSLVGLEDTLDVGSSAWGLTTLRERSLADLDASPSSGESEQTWLLQLGRHMSQVWFGNVVGFDWWSSAWLREGFATFFQYYAPTQTQMDAIFWQLPGQFYTRALAPALNADAVEGSRALSDDVSGSQESIDEALGVVTSGKGAATVQMLKHVLEDNDVFTTGLKYYVQDNKYSPDNNADQLFAAMQRAVTLLDAGSRLPENASLSDVFQTWVDGHGYPVVTVIRDYDAKTATLTQERFLLHSSEQDEQGAWWVPVTYALQKQYQFINQTPNAPVKAWLPPEDSLTIDLDDNEQWLLVNTDRRDFFRVNYDVRNWLLLSRSLSERHTTLQPVARAALVDDALALSRSGRLDYAIALHLLDYLRLDVGLAPWEAARRGFEYLDAQLYQSPHEAVYREWLLQLVDQAFLSVGFEPQPEDRTVDRLTRAVVSAWACDLSHPMCVEYAAAAFPKWLRDGDSVGHDTLAATVCVGVRGATTAVVKEVVAKLASEPDDALRAAIIQGLGCAQHVTRLLFDLATSAKSGLRRGEGVGVWRAATRFGPRGVSAALQYLQATQRASASTSIVDALRVLSDRVTSQNQLDQLSSLASGLEGLQGWLRLATDNIEWRADQLESVVDVLLELVPEPPTPTDPVTNTPTTDTTFFTLPPSSLTTAATLPPLSTQPPTGSTNPTGATDLTDPATNTPSTKPTPFTLPPSSPTTAATLPTLPTLPPTDPATRTAPTETTSFTMPPASPTTAATLPPLSTDTPTDIPTDPATRTPPTGTTVFTLPPTNTPTVITLPTLSTEPRPATESTTEEGPTRRTPNSGTIVRSSGLMLSVALLTMLAFKP